MRWGCCHCHAFPLLSFVDPSTYLFQVTMSSVTWSFDESVGEEGRGYADDAAELFSSVGSSILGSVEGGDQPLTWEVAGNTSAEVVGSSNETEEEGEVEIEIDAIGEWDGVTTAPPPTVPRWAFFAC
ncbi:uncharacterized protein LOC128195464 [Vigna angularis]|uniref:uncharacterized protein LOC128195464 n=1 Tax=Phaseolus angularis TaxID=3914 RepID=UPI0022B34E7B|nr:uncharacterized protein LOC128195464 [Vigna angularis]